MKSNNIKTIKEFIKHQKELNPNKKQREKKITIDSVADFITKLKDNQPYEGWVRYYRGQNVDLPMLPAVFRNIGHERSEDKMFYDIVNKKPEEFANCRCTFDHLVKMQHYGIPTRLLDITSNPLVALYFACTRSYMQRKDSFIPIIYSIDIIQSSVKNYNSDSITIISNLSKCNYIYKSQIERTKTLIKKIIKSSSEIIYDIINKEYPDGNIKDINKDFLNEEELVKYTIDSITYIKFKHEIKPIVEHFIKEVIIQIRSVIALRNQRTISDILKLVSYYFNTKIENTKLLNETRQDKPYFEDRMMYKTFQNVFAVNPKLDNPRIIQQSGAFLLFPYKEVEMEDAFNDKWYVNKDKVDDILDELDALNINKESLLNDMDTVCSSIKERYSKTIKGK